MSLKAATATARDDHRGRRPGPGAGRPGGSEALDGRPGFLYSSPPAAEGRAGRRSWN